MAVRIPLRLLETRLIGRSMSVCQSRCYVHDSRSLALRDPRGADGAQHTKPRRGSHLGSPERGFWGGRRGEAATARWRERNCYLGPKIHMKPTVIVFWFNAIPLSPQPVQPKNGTSDQSLRYSKRVRKRGSSLTG